MRSCARGTKAVLPKYLAVKVCEAHFCSKNKIEWYDYIRNWIIKDYPFYYEIIQKILKDNKLK